MPNQPTRFPDELPCSSPPGGPFYRDDASGVYEIDVSYRQMAFLVRATTGAMVLLTGCTIYTPALLTPGEDNAGGASGAAGAGNPCNTGSLCTDAGPDGSSGAGGSAGTGGGGAAGAGGAAIPDDAPSFPYVTST